MTDRQLLSRLSYPNPFKPTGIEFDLPLDAMVSLSIMDSSGKEIVNLINSEFRRSGTHTVTIDFELYGNGNYFFRLIAISEKETFSDPKRI